LLRLRITNPAAWPGRAGKEKAFPHDVEALRCAALAGVLACLRSLQASERNEVERSGGAGRRARGRRLATKRSGTGRSGATAKLGVRSFRTGNRGQPSAAMLRGAVRHAERERQRAQARGSWLGRRPTGCRGRAIRPGEGARCAPEGGRLDLSVHGRPNAKVSDGWPSSNPQIAKQRGGPAIRSTVLLNEAAPRRGKGTPRSAVFTGPVAVERSFGIVLPDSGAAWFGRPAASRRTGRQTKTSSTVRMHKKTRPFTPA